MAVGTYIKFYESRSGSCKQQTVLQTFIILAATWVVYKYSVSEEVSDVFELIIINVEIRSILKCPL